MVVYVQRKGKQVAERGIPEDSIHYEKVGEETIAIFYAKGLTDPIVLGSAPDGACPSISRRPGDYELFVTRADEATESQALRQFNEKLGKMISRRNKGLPRA